MNVKSTNLVCGQLNAKKLNAGTPASITELVGQKPDF